MNISAFDLLRFVPEVERISASKMKDEQKELVLKEMLLAVPEPVFCASALRTRDYVIETIKGALDGCAKNTTTKIPTKKREWTRTTKSAEEQLLLKSDENTRGQSVTQTVVDKATQKRRSAKRSS